MADLPDLSELPRRNWRDTLRTFVEERGTWTQLDDDHTVLQYGEGQTLLVTFESIPEIRNAREDAIPLGVSMAHQNGWASMTIMAHDHTWFRSAAVYAYFDQLIDEDVFEDFDRVVFFGEGMGGYGAAAFSVAAPGCAVVAISPQATLDPRVTEWDPRFVSKRKYSFNDRFGFAPDMIEAAGSAFILYNPDEDLDAMHAALFARSDVDRFRCRLMGPDLGAALDDLNLVSKAVKLAAEGKLTVSAFAREYRARRTYAPYLRALLTQVEDAGRPRLTAMLCSSVLERKNMPRFRKALQRLIDQGVVEALESADV